MLVRAFIQHTCIGIGQVHEVCWLVLLCHSCVSQGPSRQAHLRHHFQAKAKTTAKPVLLVKRDVQWLAAWHVQEGCYGLAHLAKSRSSELSRTGSLAGRGLGVSARGPPLTEAPSDSGVAELAVTASGVSSSAPERSRVLAVMHKMDAHVKGS